MWKRSAGSTTATPREDLLVRIYWVRQCTVNVMGTIYTIYHVYYFLLWTQMSRKPNKIYIKTCGSVMSGVLWFFYVIYRTVFTKIAKNDAIFPPLIFNRGRWIQVSNHGLFRDSILRSRTVISTLNVSWRLELRLNQCLEISLWSFLTVASEFIMSVDCEEDWKCLGNVLLPVSLLKHNSLKG